MKILIGYNGSEASAAALNELRYAGLPDDIEALILTVAESWGTPKTAEEARRISAAGTAKVRELFPEWTVAGEIASGSPPREILARSAAVDPDLIVVGEPRHNLSEHNMFMGRTSHVLLTESKYSVRIARGGSNSPLHAERIIVGFDGSAGSMHAVESIAERRWSAGSEVRLLAVADASVLGSIGRFTPQMTNAVVETKFASQWAEALAARSVESLKKAAIIPSVTVRLGDPKSVIIKEASDWNADTIFVGPHCSPNSFERFLLGSVSAAVAAQAPCSVEVVRKSV